MRASSRQQRCLRLCSAVSSRVSAILVLATPIILEGLPVYALNMSVQDLEPRDILGAEIGKYLTAFASRCKQALCTCRADASPTQQQDQAPELASPGGNFLPPR